MNPLTTMVAQAHIDELLAEAAAERLARNARPADPHPGRIATALKSVWSTLSGAADRPVAPTLANYPY